MSEAFRDQNFITTFLGTSSVDGVTPVNVYVDPTTHRLLVDFSGGDGTVTTVSVVSANGFAGTVASATTTPAITITTTVTGILSGNGTSISAATTTGSGSVVLATSPTLVTPNLGTPSSAVLTNATGLPIAGLSPSTSTPIGVGEIELGNASDTTLTRLSAGVLGVEGQTVHTSGRSNNFGAFTAYFTETDNGNSSTADTINWGLSNKQKSTLTGNCTFTFTAPAGPASLILKLVQDATGSRTVTWPAAVHWPGGTAPTLTTTANKVDIITFYYDGTTYFGNSSLNFTA